MSARSERETHEVDLYCPLLDKKIKKFDEEVREEIMHEIDDLLCKKKNRNQTYVSRAHVSSTVSVSFSALSAQLSLSLSSESQFSNVPYVPSQQENSQVYSTHSHQPSGST